MKPSAIAAAGRAAALMLAAFPLGALRGQERPLPPMPPTDWRITFGASTGRFHENVVRHIVTDRGQLAYVDKRDAEPAMGQIPAESVREIARLVNALALETAKPIPSDRFNACIGSLHLPNVWFSVRRGGATTSLSHCNTGGLATRPRYQYTLNLSTDQQRVYTSLRARLESLFDAELKAKGGTRQQQMGDAMSGAECWPESKRAEERAKGRRASEEPPLCGREHACRLVPPSAIREVTGRTTVATYAPASWQSGTTSDCFHQSLVVSIRLVNRGWTGERLEAQRQQAVRDGFHVQAFGSGGVNGYTVFDAPMVGMTGPYTGETAFVVVGEKLLAISVQTFPEDYLAQPQRDGTEPARRGSVTQLIVAAAARLAP